MRRNTLRYCALQPYCWHKDEWFKFPDEEMRDFVVEGFCDFYAKDRDMNLVDFIYMYNGSGILEFQMERDSRRISLKRFQRDLAKENRQMKSK